MRQFLVMLTSCAVLQPLQIQQAQRLLALLEFDHKVLDCKSLKARYHEVQLLQLSGNLAVLAAW